MKTEDKCWGTVTHIFHSNTAAVSHLRVKAGTRCSRHYHQERVNHFCVLSGKVVIEEWHNHPELWLPSMATVLSAGQHHTVLANIPHRFRVLEDGEMIEIYWPSDYEAEVRLDDIVRFDEGGPDI